jgi:uncharacterized surface protein with fasciclin (FAS1) repeats
MEGRMGWRGGLPAVAAILIAATPASARDILEVLRASGNHAMFLVAVERAGLLDALRAAGPITLLAPHDTAFRELEDGGGFEMLLVREDRLREVIAYHILPGAVDLAEMAEGAAIATLQGKEVVFLRSGGASVNHARLIKTDIAASNGVVHAIDEILIPPGL